MIGQLYGSGPLCLNPNCSNPSEDIGNYGKFSSSWTGNGASDNRRRLDHWLDPVGTNPTTLNGRRISYISGPSVSCFPNNTTFTLNNRPSGTTVNWTKSSNLSYVSGHGTNSYVVEALNPTSGSSGWVKVEISDAQGNSITLEKDLWVGELGELTIISPSVAYGESDFSVFANPESPFINYNWSVSGADIVSGQGTDELRLSSECGNMVVVSCTASVCGSSDNAFKKIRMECDNPAIIPGLLSVIPNPADDYIEVFIENLAEEEYLNTEKLHIKLINNRSTPVYNGTTQQKKFQINTSNFPEGLYYLVVQYKDQKYTSTILISH
ncbi:MAG: T9SS type A sorting domain-containing protein [Bacteroidales bacterium]|nr:T9SS type A sorting domain-containing protein [Bacteroidales bacterium]